MTFPELQAAVIFLKPSSRVERVLSTSSAPAPANWNQRSTQASVDADFPASATCASALHLRASCSASDIILRLPAPNTSSRSANCVVRALLLRPENSSYVHFP